MTENKILHRLAEAIGDNEILILANHGCITVGETLAVAFDHAYYIERAAMVIVELAKTNSKYKKIDENVAKMTFNQLENNKKPFALVHLNAFIKKYNFE